MNGAPHHHDFFSPPSKTAFGATPCNTLFGSPSNTLFGSSSGTLLGPSASTSAVSCFSPLSPSSGLFGLRNNFSNALLDSAFNTLDVYVKTPEEAAAVRSGLSGARCTLNIYTLSMLQPFAIDLPDDGLMKVACICMPGVDPSTLDVELDQPARQVLLVKGFIHGKPFSLTRNAPRDMRFVIDKEHITLDQGLLTIRYTFESSRSFEKIY